MESYITIKSRASFLFEDRKSRFIAEVSPVESESEAIDFIDEIRKKYPGANHYVYAYVLREGSTTRYTDDREPQGTAGMPVLDSIRKNGITNAVVVVVRYFGGTLLGTGGLVHAYSSAALGALRDAGIITYDIYSTLMVECGYSDYQRLGAVFEELGFRTESSDYSDKIEILGSLRRELEEKLEDKLTEITSGRVKITKICEKFDY